MGKRLPEIITEDELVKLVKAAKNQRHKDAIAIAFYEGLRISELVGLGREVSKCCKEPVIKEMVDRDDNE